MHKGLTYINGALVALASMLVVFSTNIPYSRLDANPPDGMHFSGISTNIPDVASYMMWIRQHAEGKFMVHNHMTVDPHAPILPNPAWLMAGGVKALFHTSTLFAYHAVRIVLGLIYLQLLYILLARVFKKRSLAWLSWILIAAGGGLGWLELTGIHVPSADWMTELWSWPSMLHYPHFVLSLILVVAFMLLIPGTDERSSRPRAVWAGVVLTILALVHPYTAGTVLAATTLVQIFGVWRARVCPEGDIRPSRHFWYMFAAAMPGFIALAVQTLLNPMVATWASQNVMPSPPPWEYALGFGFVGLAAAAVAVRIIRGTTRPSSPMVYAIIWIVSACVLAYADPLVPFARRCVEGIHIGVVILAVGLIADLKSPLLRATVAIVLLATALPAPALHVSREVSPQNPGYVSDDFDQMIDSARYWIKDGKVLADLRTSLFLAAETDASVYAAHHEVTPGFKEKIRRVYKFKTTPTTVNDRDDLMDSIGCDWAIISPHVAYGLLIQNSPDDLKNSRFKEYARGVTWVLIGPRDLPTKTDQ